MSRNLAARLNEEQIEFVPDLSKVTLFVSAKRIKGYGLKPPQVLLLPNQTASQPPVYRPYTCKSS